ncbi:hypothetical protein Tco_0412894 [Tanacetum coccineum]
MDDPNITMEEYIRLEEEKARKRGKVFNYETAKYGKIWYDEDIHDLRSIETEFPAIAFNDEVSSEKTLSCEPTVSSLNDEIDFRVSFDDLDDEDYKNEFPAIVYNDAQTSKADLLTEPILNPQHIDEFDLNDETSVSEYDEEEQNVLYFNDLFPFNIIHPDDLKSEKDNDGNEIDIIQSLGSNEITQGSNLLSESSHDKITKTFRTGSFVMNLNVNIMIWNYYANGMLFYLIINLYFPFGIPFDPKRYYKDADCALILRRPRHPYLRYEGLQYTDADIADFEARLTRIYRREVHRVQVFNFGGLTNLIAEGLSDRMLIEYRDAQGQSVFNSRAWMRIFDIRGPLVHELILEFFSTFRFGEAVTDLDIVGALQFHLGGTVGFGAYWAESARQIPEKRDLRDYWIGISSAGYFLGTTPSYTAIRDLILRLCHRLIACSIVGRSQAPKKVTMTDLFYLRMNVGLVNVPYILTRYLRLFAARRKSGAHISGRQFVARLAEHFGLLTAEILQGLTVIALKLPIIDMAELARLQICVEIDDTLAWEALGPERQPDATTGAPGVAQDALVVDEGIQADPTPVQAPPPPPLAASRTMPQRMARLKDDVHEIHRVLTEQREVIDVMARDFSRFIITSLARMMYRAGVTYTRYSKTPREYQRRRVRQRTGEASTSTTQQDQQQPDP